MNLFLRWAEAIEERFSRTKRQRKSQLIALRDSLPKTPPEKMRVAIAVNLIPKTAFYVDLIIELNETERAIIREHCLDEFIVAEEPYYTQDELRRFEQEHALELRRINKPERREIVRHVHTVVMHGFKTKKRITRVGDLITSPHSRHFPTQQLAHAYVNILKTDYLPQIRKFIEEYQDYKPTQIIEF